VTGRGTAHRGRHARPADQIFRSSFFLMGSTVTVAGLGFVFWVLVARLYSPAQVGLATSLISAVSLISYLSLFGLNSTLIRFPAPEGARNGQLTQAISIVAGLACVVGTLYLLGLPLYGPKLIFVRDRPLLALAFVVFCACGALNLLADSAFVSAKLPQYNVLIDGLVPSAAKLALPFLLVGSGAVGILASVGGGYVLACAAALLLLRRQLGFRFDLRARGARLREQLRFSSASYVSSLLNLAPLLALPLIVLARLGAQAAGYYYIAFQIANLLNAISFAVGEAVFAEVSTDWSRYGNLLRRAAAIIAAVQIPAAAAVALGSGLLLRLFGGSYTAQAQPLLVVLAVGALAVALNTWASFALKLVRKLKHLILSNVVYAGVTIGLAALWAHHGLVWLGAAWAAGNLASGLYALAALLVGPAPEAVPTEESLA
jgi:O-antigen/teichoic acid export membrane protein